MRALRTQPTPLRHALRALRAASSRRVGPAMTRAHVDFRDIKATGDAYVQAPEMAALLAKGPDVVVRRQSPGAAATDRAMVEADAVSEIRRRLWVRTRLGFELGCVP